MYLAKIQDSDARLSNFQVNVQDVVSAADGDKLHLDTVEGAQPAQQQEREEGGGLGKRSRQDGNGKGKGKEGAGEQEEEEEEDEEEEKLDCSICMCAVTDDADAASLDKCIHAFHFACIIKVSILALLSCLIVLISSLKKSLCLVVRCSAGVHLSRLKLPNRCLSAPLASCQVR